MTNEEALRILHCPSAYITDEDSELAHTIPMFSKAYGQAMAVAFEALEQTETLKSLINDFRDYQKEWLTSHKDIEFDIPEEDLILAFLDDTADCYISEHIS